MVALEKKWLYFLRCLEKRVILPLKTLTQPSVRVFQDLRCWHLRLRVFLNGERLTMNRLHLLLIIINNASLPIYLPLTNHSYWSSPPRYTQPIPHCTHTSYTHIHAHHTHTNPHFSHMNTSFSCSFPPPPSVLHHHSAILSLPHPLTTSSQPPASISAVNHHPSLAHVSNPIWRLQQDLHSVDQEDKSKGSEDFLGSNPTEVLTETKSKGCPLWNPFKASCLLVAVSFFRILSNQM